MEKQPTISRRLVVKSSMFGLLTAAVPNILFAKHIQSPGITQARGIEGNTRYPAIEEEIVAEVVGLSHFNLDRLKELVKPRPELARATWDWGFGDWETAIGAASHVGRKDIVDYLLANGARPDIFTFAMLGSYQIVKSIIEFTPRVQRIPGPHGISLLQHVKNGLRGNENTKESEKLIAHLEALGDADGENYLVMEEQDKQKYLGDYMYGDGANDGFSIKLNLRKIITLGKLGKNGGALYKIGDNNFMYNGAPSVNISFQFDNANVVSLTVIEPGLKIIAKKIAG